MSLLRECLRIRRVEEKVAEVYSSDVIQSPVHLAIGQEAVAVALCANLTDGDLLYATYRSHAYYLAKGGSLRAFFAELMGRQGGCCSGKGGSMHLAYPQKGFMGTSAIVASSLPNAAGSALAAKLEGSDRVVVAVIGDGAAEEGVYHEVLNFVALKSLPLLIVIENNGWAVHASLAERQGFEMHRHAESYGIPAHSLGVALDPEALSGQFHQVISSVRETRAPAWVAVDTFRLKEHVGPAEDFDAGYRTTSEMELWLKQEWSASSWPTRDADERAIAEEIDDSYAWALSQPVPDTSSLFTDVY